MALAFKKASKQQAKLRAAFFGPSGAGKTYTALRVATGIGGSIAVIDTERGSASKYADRFTFDVLDLPEHGIDTYVEAINAAGEAGYNVLIIDSLSHAWQELLEGIDKLANAKYRGNTWSAWSEGTPKQRRLVDAILNYPGHIVATMRSKTAWEQEKDERTGKTKPVRVGLAPEQGKGIEYEFDLLLELTVDHTGNVLKDRTGKFQDQLLAKPGEEFGKQLAAWLSEGTLPPKPAPRDERAKLDEEFVAAVVGAAQGRTDSEEAVEAIIARVKSAAKVEHLEQVAGPVRARLVNAINAGHLDSDETWAAYQTSKKANTNKEQPANV